MNFNEVGHAKEDVAILTWYNIESKAGSIDDVQPIDTHCLIYFTKVSLQ